LEKSEEMSAQAEVLEKEIWDICVGKM